MFGCCVAGRLLQTNLQQIDDTHALFEISAAENINHICVFLLGTVFFPEGYGATVHFFWPGKGSQVLGMLSNDKPSAIFRLRSTFTSPSNPSSGIITPAPFASFANSPSNPTGQSITAILGFAIEPLHAAAAQLAASGAGARQSTVAAMGLDAGVLAEKIAKHLLNYVAGFVPVGGTGSGAGMESVIPMSVIVRWYESFVSKVRAGGTAFLEREG